MDQRKIFKTLEIIWLISAGLCVLITVYFLITKETDSALYFFFMFLISGIMYALRRYQRKRQDEGWKKPGADKRQKQISQSFVLIKIISPLFFSLMKNFQPFFWLESKEPKVQGFIAFCKNQGSQKPDDLSASREAKIIRTGLLRTLIFAQNPMRPFNPSNGNCAKLNNS